MSDSIERRVCTVVACVLDVPPADVRPESAILAGLVSYERMRLIRRRLEAIYAIELPLDAHEGWVTVADVILATENANAASTERATEAFRADAEKWRAA